MNDGYPSTRTKTYRFARGTCEHLRIACIKAIESPRTGKKRQKLHTLECATGWSATFVRVGLNEYWQRNSGAVVRDLLTMVSIVSKNEKYPLKLYYGASPKGSKLNIIVILFKFQYLGQANFINRQRWQSAEGNSGPDPCTKRSGPEFLPRARTVHEKRTITWANPTWTARMRYIWYAWPYLRPDQWFNIIITWLVY